MTFRELRARFRRIVGEATYVQDYLLGGCPLRSGGFPHAGGSVEQDL
jgi:hypothetical protein